MQNIETLSDNPLKINQETQLSPSSTKKISKINPKYFLILIPITLGVLSLLVSSLAKRNSTNSTKQQKSIPTITLNQDTNTPTNTDTNNAWQQELNSLNQEINLDQDITPPKIEEDITF